MWCVCRSGAELIENTPVKDAHFDKSTGLWTVTIEDSDVTYQVHTPPPDPPTLPTHPSLFQGRVLICADGSTSKLATQLGLVTGPPQATCSRSYIGAGTHSFKADGVMFYPRGILPGRANPIYWILLHCRTCVYSRILSDPLLDEIILFSAPTSTSHLFNN